MKLLYTRYMNAQQQMLIVIERYQELESKDETPSYLKILIVQEERTMTISYADFLEGIKEKRLTQIFK